MKKKKERLKDLLKPRIFMGCPACGGSGHRTGGLLCERCGGIGKLSKPRGLTFKELKKIDRIKAFKKGLIFWGGIAGVAFFWWGYAPLIEEPLGYWEWFLISFLTIIAGMLIGNFMKISSRK